MNRIQLLVSSLFLSSFLIFESTPVNAQITPDTSLGNESSQINPNVLINGLQADQINGGATRGSNLFHSFSEFNIKDGQRVYFANPSGVFNILTRVTGKNASSIFGTLGVDGNANLFLINPNGILLGKNASLDMRGSFVGTTADNIKFGDGIFFSAKDNQNTPLLTVSTPIGLQFGGNQGNITNQSQSINLQSRQSLLLIGNNVNLDGAKIQVPDGLVELLGIKGTGNIGLELENNTSGGEPRIHAVIPVNLEKGNVSLNGSQVNVAGRGVGSIVVNSKNFDMSGGSQLLAGIGDNLTAASQKPGDINIQATSKVNLVDESLIANHANLGSNGNTGNININTDFLEVVGGRVSTRTLGTGKAGNITVKAGEVYVNNPSYQSPGSDINLEDKPAFNAGNYKNDADNGKYHGLGFSGNISISADRNITLIGEGKDSENKVISTYSASGGKGGGSISLNANGFVFLSNAYVGNPSFDGVQADVSIFGKESVSIVENSRIRSGNDAKRAGDIVIKSDGLVSLKNSFLDSDSGGKNFQAGSIIIQGDDIYISKLFNINRALLNTVNGKGGFSGTVSLIAQGNITLIGNNFDANNLLISTFADIGGLQGGDISLKANSINLTSAYLISGSEKGNGGNISLLGDNSVSISDNSSLLSGTNAGKSGNINIQSSGDILLKQSLLLSGVGGRKDSLNAIGGDISLNGRSIFVTNGSEITARASREAVDELPGGSAGNIRVNATKEFIISGRNSYPLPQNTRPDATVYSALLTGVGPTANGAGGDITINAPIVQISDGGILRAESQSTFSGGNITVNAQTIDLSGGGKIFTGALGSGNAGNTVLNASKRITISGSNADIPGTFKLVTQNEGEQKARIKFGSDNPASGVFAGTFKLSDGRGGNLAIASPILTLKNGAVISVSSEGLGSAGNIDIQARTISLDNKASITANTGEQATSNFNALSLDGQGFVTANTRNSNNNREQATINLKTDALILRRNSNITTNATGQSVIGGNINIDAGVIAAFENSDISANSSDFRGGRVKINTEGIFGTQARNFLTPESDITATGANPSLNGTTEINVPDVDPSKGLIELAEGLTDQSAQIDQLCGRGRIPLGRFVVVGKNGSIQTNPVINLVQGEVDLTSLATLDESNSTNRANRIPDSLMVQKQPQNRIVEAQAIARDAEGTLYLVAEAPNVTPYSRPAVSSCAAVGK
jgi:filamentous hemagglutinin family protein